MNILKIGVIGTGRMGKNHIRNLSEEKRFELVGIYDVDTECACGIASKYDIKAFDSVEALLHEVEAVVIAVPSSLHKEYAFIAADNGVNALVEKPIATNADDAREIVKAFADKNLVLMVGHIERFNPAFRELKSLVCPENIFYIEANRFSAFEDSGRIKDTTVVEDLMIHDVDLVCALMGDTNIISVRGCGEIVSLKQTGFATCMMNFECRDHVIVNASRVAQNKKHRITVHIRDSLFNADLLRGI